MDFRIRGLDPAPFALFFGMDDAALAAARAVRCRADSKPGFPCRVSLDDAEPGDEVLLLNFEHLPLASPYRASHAIYVSAGARAAFDAVNEIPPALGRRLLSLRAFDAGGMMVDADIVEGSQAEPLIARLLRRADVDFVHAHFARRGCYAARIDRA
ncbi:MAG TPA: DUF1203 domain-containing protein [Usitatibacter sp.]|nr:DUF1203 domain-containing protein [Usitatibacter sp.]